MTAKISACILCRDDAVTIGPLLEKLRPHVDEIVVVDTGSTDDSPRICQKYADKWSLFLDCNDEQERIDDFALARQNALDIASNDWHLWVDADDDIVGAETLRSLAAQRDGQPTMYLIPYDYQHDAQGRCTLVHWRENLVYPRADYNWQIPVHEVLVPKTPGRAQTIPTDAARRIHRKELSKRPHEPGRNLRILTKYVKRMGEGDVRALYYLGVEYAKTGKFEDLGNALRVLERYVQLSNWSDERCLAQLEIARVYFALRHYRLAIEWALQAMVTKSWAEPYWTIAYSFYKLAEMEVEADTNYRKAAHFAQLGLRSKPTDTVLFTNPMERFEIHRMLNVAEIKVGNVQGAYDSCLAGLAGLPDDPDLTNNRNIYEGIITKQRVVVDLGRLQALGQVKPEDVGLMHQVLSGQLTVEMLQGPTAQAVGKRIEPQQAESGCLDVVFFVGHGMEPWNPETLAAGGMGGSETMAWNMARGLRALGHRVRLFGHCSPEQEGVFDGVEWYDASRCPGTACDVLIVSRQPAAVDPELGITARCRLFWVHDVHAGDALNQTRALRFDRILALSEWHKAFLLQCYPSENPPPILIARLRLEDVRVTRNGLDPGRFHPMGFDTSRVYRPPGGDNEIFVPIDRDPHRVVFSSSPDRGLFTLLDIWPRVVEEVPDATLHIYYGFEMWERVIEMTGDTAAKTVLRRMKHQIKTMPGVTNHGRVSGAELAAEFLRSGVWAYPTWFSETSCITAMEAQAAGLYCVATPVAALKETLGERGTLVPGVLERPGAQPPEFLDAFTAATIAALRGEGQPRTREELQEFARGSFDLASLALDWDAMIREELAAVDLRVVPAFRRVA